MKRCQEPFDNMGKGQIYFWVRAGAGLSLTIPLDVIEAIDVSCGTFLSCRSATFLHLNFQSF